MSMVLLPILIVLLGAAFWAGRMSAGGTTPAAAPAASPRDLAERDAFIEQLRELAWQHRDVSPELSTIIIDEIQTHHRRISRGPDA
jgi:hypothetical protein